MTGEPPAVQVSGTPPSEPAGLASAPSPPSQAPRVPRRSRAARRSRRSAIRVGFRRLVAAIEQGDEQIVEAEVLRWSQAWRPLAPLAMCVGAFVMLFQGLRRLWTNWRLILVEALPAMWAWATMLDLKAHVLGGRGFRVWQGPPAIGLVAATVIVTVAAFYLNAVFAFALAEPEGAAIRPAFANANRNLWMVSCTGIVVGAAVGVSAFVVPRWGLGWFTFALGIAVGAQMLASVLVPARLVGKRRPSAQPRRDRLVAAVIAGVLGAVVCTPSYALGRFGIVLLGSHGLFVLGITLLVIGFTLQSGAAGAVKAIKASTKAAAAAGRTGTGGRAPLLTTEDDGRTPRPAGHPDPDPPPPHHRLSAVAGRERRKEPVHDALPLVAAVAALPA